MKRDLGVDDEAIDYMVYICCILQSPGQSLPSRTLAFSYFGVLNLPGVRQGPLAFDTINRSSAWNSIWSHELFKSDRNGP